MALPNLASQIEPRKVESKEYNPPTDNKPKLNYVVAVGFLIAILCVAFYGLGFEDGKQRGEKLATEKWLVEMADAIKNVKKYADTLSVPINTQKR